MNLAFQLSRHLAQHLRQWPASDPQATAWAIRRALLSGNAWVYPEPTQLELSL